MSNTLTSLSITQLKRAVALKEKIEFLTRELDSLVGTPTTTMPTKRGPRQMSAAAKARISAAAKARWAKIKGAAQPAPAKAKPAKRKMSAAGRARISAAAKARWAQFHAAKKA